MSIFKGYPVRELPENNKDFEGKFKFFKIYITLSEKFRRVSSKKNLSLMPIDLMPI